MNLTGNIVALWQTHIAHVLSCRRRGVGCYSFCQMWWTRPLRVWDLNMLFPIDIMNYDGYEVDLEATFEDQ